MRQKMALTVSVLWVSVTVFPAWSQELPSGHGCISVTSYGATPDDQKDDTPGFQNGLIAAIQQYQGAHCYVPPGTYYVSNTIGGNSSGSVWWRFFTLRGAGPEKTLIKLRANSAGFNDRLRPKPVFYFFFSNNATHAVWVEHLTIEIESGNPGATALKFSAHNGGGVRNVVLRAAPNSGYYGLDKSETPGPELVENLRVYGFEKGVYLGGGMYSVTFLNLHVEGQRVYGVHNNGVPTQIHNFTSNNTVRAIHSGGNNLVLINAVCNGGSVGECAVAAVGSIYIRNFSCKNSVYSHAVADGYSGQNKVGPEISEYCSEKIQMTFPSPATSLNLELKTPPSVAWDPPAQWGEVRALGGFPAAVASGKSTIYFRGDMAVANNGEVHVNNSALKRIVGFGRAYGGKVVFDNPDPHSIVVAEHLEFAGGVEVKSAGTVILRCFDGNVTISGNGETYIEDYCCGTITIAGAKVWGWQINTESITSENGTRITNDGGRLVVVGVKTEGNDAVLTNRRGAKSELLGGFIYPVGNDLPNKNPAFINDNSDIWLFHNRLAWDYTSYIREIRDGKTQDVTPQFGFACAYVTNFGSSEVLMPIQPIEARVTNTLPMISSSPSAIIIATPPLALHLVTITNLTGRRIFYYKGWGREEYRVSATSQGVYLAKIASGSRITAKTIVCDRKEK